MRRWLAGPLAGLGTAVLLAGCGAVPPPTNTAAPEPVERSVPPAGVRLEPPVDGPVLAISVDGLRPETIDELGTAGAPVLHRFFELGAGTDDARTAVESTETLPNHTGMLTGRRVDEDHGGHGVDWNHRYGLDRVDEVESVFTVVDDADMPTALVASKEKFELFPDSWGEAVGHYDLEEGADGVVEQALRRAGAMDGPGLVFAHISTPDHVGHDHGWDGSEYDAAVAEVDTALAAAEEAYAAGELGAVVLTADHGGAEGAERHKDPNVPENFTVPFVVVAPGVPAGSDLAALVGVVPPDGKQASYGGAQPVRNADLGNTVAALLGLEPIPGSEFRAVYDALTRD